jgi:hypothetical protein
MGLPLDLPDVRMPFACGHDGALRWARDKRRDPCVCAGCGADVVLRAGALRRPHYAHAAVLPCSRETALHRAAIAILSEELAAASRARRPVVHAQRCGVCGDVALRDLAAPPDLEVVPELPVASAVRPDLVARSGGRLRYAIEVVVTHAPEPGALAALRGLALPVVLVRPSWDALASLELPLASIAALGETSIEGARCRSWRHPPSRAPACGRCRGEREVVTMQRWDAAACWACGEAVPFADLRAPLDEATSCERPVRHLGRGARAIAAAIGVRLVRAWSYRSGRVELMHACARCGARHGRDVRPGAVAPSAVQHAAWCRRCDRLSPIGAPRTRSARP